MRHAARAVKPDRAGRAPTSIERCGDGPSDAEVAAISDATAGLPDQENEDMRTAKIQLRLPEDMKDAAIRQASASGISLNLFVATAVAARIGAQSEAERYFSARGSRTTPARAKALLMRLGTPGKVRDDDRLDTADDPA
jgi:uncharacterized protein (DUF1778 family)